MLVVEPWDDWWDDPYRDYYASGLTYYYDESWGKSIQAPTRTTPRVIQTPEPEPDLRVICLD